ncbi:hypothetical protein [Streptomyces sp. SM12]|uniref:hypothetical protein n=1 Tax=Streptomyces sp. SM12 TaxID=1071602 RepID=UPI000CD54FAB|nr:hypothetical protein [Streptomyces sp. SM12]
MLRNTGWGARTGSAAVTLLATIALLGCEVKERAVDCAKLAIAVSRAYDELERTALTSALDQEPDQLTDAIRSDAQKVRDRAGNVDVRQAADSVLEAVRSTERAIAAGERPDLSALGDATGELTRACTPV